MTLLDRLWKRRERVQPEALWRVSVEDDTIGVVDREGTGARLAIADQVSVVIETNDSGPWLSDVWWLLFNDEGNLGAGWPQGATGERAAIDRLMTLPGFDAEEMIRAMTSTDNAVFVLWRRDEERQR